MAFAPIFMDRTFTKAKLAGIIESASQERDAREPTLLSYWSYHRYHHPCHGHWHRFSHLLQPFLRVEDPQIPVP